MTNTDRDGSPAAHEGFDGQGAWMLFEKRLGAYLTTMSHEVDHLLLESSGDDETGCAPYAQFATFGEGTLLHAELTGNRYLADAFEVSYDDCHLLQELGWDLNWAEGEVLEGSDEVPMDNWSQEAATAQGPLLARAVVCALRDVFGVAHPQLLTHRAWGPAAEHVRDLGLLDSADVPPESPVEMAERSDPVALIPSDRQELLKFVEQALTKKFGVEPSVDPDSDFELEHLGQPVWIHVPEDLPVVKIMARVAHEVRSRRAASIEISVLNRDEMWSRWSLRGHDIWQVLMIPAFPFAPGHLDAMLDCYFDAMTQTRDDLVLRLGAQVG